MSKIRLCCPCHFGLESVLKYEITKIGGENLIVSDGRISFDGDFNTLAAANLWLSTAERVLIELGSFRADTFDMLFEGVKALPLENFIGKNDAFPNKGSSIDSTLTSIPAIQSIIKKACVDRLASKYKVSYFEETGAVHQIRFSILKNIATIYLDTSGVGLHKRGYRRNSNDAPIKETLAAGIVDLARIRPDSIVCDPMCGSGTFLIESAYKALKIAPGIRRSFASEKWNQIPKSVWADERQKALSSIDKEAKFHGFGFDIDENCVYLTEDNAKKAGVFSKLDIKYGDIRDFSHLSIGEKSTVIVNPPYGERLLQIKEAEELYKKMGQVLSPSSDRPCFIISPHEEFETFFGKRADKKRKLYNGMIKCNLFMYFK